MHKQITGTKPQNISEDLENLKKALIKKNVISDAEIKAQKVK